MSGCTVPHSHLWWSQSSQGVRGGSSNHGAPRNRQKYGLSKPEVSEAVLASFSSLEEKARAYPPGRGIEANFSSLIRSVFPDKWLRNEWALAVHRPCLAFARCSSNRRASLSISISDMRVRSGEGVRPKDTTQ